MLRKLYDKIKYRWRPWKGGRSAPKSNVVIEIREQDGRLYRAYYHDGVGSQSLCGGSGWMGYPIHVAVSPTHWRPVKKENRHAVT